MVLKSSPWERHQAILTASRLETAYLQVNLSKPATFQYESSLIGLCWHSSRLSVTGAHMTQIPHLLVQTYLHDREQTLANQHASDIAFA